MQSHGFRRFGRSKKRGRSYSNVRLTIHAPKLGYVNLEEIFNRIAEQKQEIELLKKELRTLKNRRRVTGLKRKK